MPRRTTSSAILHVLVAGAALAMAAAAQSAWLRPASSQTPANPPPAPPAGNAPVTTLNPPLNLTIPDIAPPAGWPQLTGDIPLDPDVTVGTLPNGMRFLIETKKQVPGKAALRFVISAGSMEEQPDQEGLAHFLEHMAFRGSKNVPEGEIQKSLERLGLRWGGDTNAGTGQDRTIYKFNLAHNDDASLDTGLKLFREIASELTLDPKAMDQERGVVLAELRLRDQPQMKLQLAQLAWQLGDHPYTRSPGGRTEVIEKAPVARMRAFYDAYYRPENGLIVVTGDVDPKAVAEKIKAQFSDWKGRGAPGTKPGPLIRPVGGDPVSVATIDGMPLATMTLQWSRPYQDAPPVRAERRIQLVEELGRVALGDRMAGVLEAAGKPAQSISGLSSGRITGVWIGSSMTAAQVADVDKTLPLMVTAYRQVAEYGITQAELDHAIEIIRALRQRGEGGGHSGAPDVLADLDVLQALGNQPFVASGPNYMIFDSQVKGISLLEVNAALKERTQGAPRLQYRGPTAPPGGVAGLRAILEKARTAALSPYAAPDAKPWPYTDFGKPGAVAERREVQDFNISFIRFENGVRLTVMPTRTRPNDVLVRVRIGYGRLQLPKDHIDAADMGVVLWRTGGLKKMTLTEQMLSLERDRVSVAVRQGEDAFLLDTGGPGSILPSKVERQFQLMTAMLSEPAFRTDEWGNSMQQSDEAEKATPFSAASVLSHDLDRLLHPGDWRFVFNTAEQRRTWKPEQTIAWMKPIVESSPIEVIVVGDVKVDAIIDAAAKTFGALPARPDIGEPKGLREVKFASPTPKPVVLTHKGAANQALGLVIWPTTDIYADAREQRRRIVLGSLLQARAMEKFRTAEGQSYSPSFVMHAERALPGYGYMGLGIDAPPEAIEGIIADIGTIAAGLAAKEVTEDEFKRAMAPQIESARAQQKDNGFWVELLGGAQTDKRGLDYQRSLEADYASMTAADIRATAERWLKASTAWKAEIIPEAFAAKVKPAPIKPAAKPGATKPAATAGAAASGGSARPN